jgi:beta-glucosidase
MKSHLSVLFASFSLLVAASSSWAITGRVLDQDSKPVSGAYITYTALDHRLLWAYSDANGLFNLAGPNGVAALPLAHATLNRTDPEVFGDLLSFSPDHDAATISLFNLAGKKIASRSYAKLSGARSTVRPFSEIARTAGHTLYIVEIRTGDHVYTTRMLNSGVHFTNTNNGAEPGAIAGPYSKTAAANQVRVGRTGYTPTFNAFTSYSANLGDVKITKIDIEAKVDSLIQVILKSPIKKQVLGGMTIMPPEGSSDYITSANAGCMMYGVNSMKEMNARRTFSNTAQGLAMANTATHLPIPLIIVGDIVHGYIYGPTGGVVMPHNIGLGSTFYPPIVEKCFRVAAIESKGAGFNFAFGPTTDVVRNDKHGRTYESYSEDPAHTATMTRAAVLGFQGGDLSHPYSIGATAKHFAGPGGTKDGLHMGITNTAPDSILRKIHLAPYRAAVDAGAGAVMAAFNSWVDASGKEIPMHGNTELMTNTLKGTMGFDGFIFGDFEAHWYMQGFFTQQLAAYTGTKVREVLGSIAINAGLDIPLGNGVTSDWDWAPHAVDAQTDGFLTEARVTDLAKRILRVKFRMGLFTGTNYLFSSDLTTTISSPMHKDVAREAVRRSLVCLKNANGVLPISKTAHVHVVGTFANNMGCQCGGWTYGGPSTWQGDTKTDVPAGTSILKAIQNVCGAANVTYSATAANIPATADVIVVATGETPYSETQGDSKRGVVWNQFTGVFNNVASSMTLADMPEGNIINQVKAATTKPIVSILISGRPMVLGTSLDNSNAFVCAWLPGTEGQGVADVLFGDFDFTGKLSFSWPTAVTDEPLNTGSWGDLDTKVTPLFPYGYGLNLKGAKLPAGFY